MSRAGIIEGLRAAGLIPRVLQDLLALDTPPRPSSSIRCVHPERHNNEDANPSLVIWKNGAGATCQACGFGGGLLDIAMDRLGLSDRKSAAAELERRYLKTGKPASPKLGEPEEVYDYQAADGTLAYQVLRFRTTDKEGNPGKTFRIRRPDPKRPGKWVWNLGRTKPVLFRLPRVLEAIERGEKIYVPEGEKDALALEAAGVTATTNHGGAGKWRPEHTEQLRGAAHVVVVADKDVPGRRHAGSVACAAIPVVPEVEIVEAKEGKDAADHLAAGHRVDDFVPVRFPKEPVGRYDPPEIVVSPKVTSVVNAGERALIEYGHSGLYQRHGQLVRVQRDRAPKVKGLQRPRRAPIISPVPDAFLLEQLAKAAVWVSGGNVPRRVLPPAWAMNVLTTRGRWDLPWLETVVEAPAFCADGSIVDAPGYDPESGILFEPNADYPPVPEKPSDKEVETALAKVAEPFSEFPFVSDADRAAALAAVLTVVARQAIYGPCPLFAVTAPIPASGKGLLVHVAVLIGTGRYPTLMAPEHNNEELRKVITTVAMEGQKAVLFDNAEGQFGSAIMAGALTATEWSGRVLGFNRIATAPLLVVWFVTGNNISFVGDTYRRTIPIRLDPVVEQPEEREFKRPDLLRYVRRERAALHVATLTILRGFVHAGRPAHGKARMGSFEAWDDIVRSAVVWGLGTDPCEARRCLREEDDAERETLRTLLHQLHRVFPNGRAVVANEMVLRAEQDPDLRAALAALDRRGDDRLDQKVIGYGLRKYRNRIVDGLRLERADAVRQGVLWRVVQLERGDGTDGGDDSGQRELDSPADAAEEPKKRFSSEGDHHRDDRHHRTEQKVLCGDGTDSGDVSGRSEVEIEGGGSGCGDGGDAPALVGADGALGASEDPSEARRNRITAAHHHRNENSIDLKHDRDRRHHRTEAHGPDDATVKPEELRAKAGDAESGAPPLLDALDEDLAEEERRAIQEADDIDPKDLS